MAAPPDILKTTVDNILLKFDAYTSYRIDI